MISFSDLGFRHVFTTIKVVNLRTICLSTYSNFVEYIILEQVNNAISPRGKRTGRTIQSDPACHAENLAGRQEVELARQPQQSPTCL